MMKKEHSQYEKALEQLRQWEPELQGADALTQSIMQSIAYAQSSRQNARRLRIAGALSGIAASLLIGLGLYDTLTLPAQKPEIRASASVRTLPASPMQQSIQLSDVQEFLQQKAVQGRQKAGLYAAFTPSPFKNPPTH